jgi:hypothetical protein
MSPRDHFNQMMRSPNFKNETYQKSGGKIEYKIEIFF